MNFDSFLSDIITGILSAALTWLLAYVLGFKKINKKIDALEQTMLEAQSSITTNLLEHNINEKNRIETNLKKNMKLEDELEQNRIEGLFSEDIDTYYRLKGDYQNKEKELEDKLDNSHKKMLEILEKLK